jgi:hypothetical protein
MSLPCSAALPAATVPINSQFRGARKLADLGIIALIPFLVVKSHAQARLEKWGVPRAVEIARYQGRVSPHRLMNQAHLTKNDAQLVLREACKQRHLYQAVNGRYYLGSAPASSGWASHKSTATHRCVKEPDLGSAPAPSGRSSHKSTATHRCVKELYAPDRTRRLFVIQREDGLVTFREDKSSFDEHSRTHSWEQSYASGLYDTAAAAENDARMIIPWLKALTH